MRSKNERNTLFGLALAAAALTATTAAQQSSAVEPVTDEPRRAQSPVTSVDPSTNPDKKRSTEIAISEPGAFVIETGYPAELDDSIPLPVDAVVDMIDGKDVVLEEASGDPYFLGFIGGKHYPPANEILDPQLALAASAGALDGRPDDVTYGFVMFSKRITQERRDALTRMGCRILGFHPHYTLKVAIPSKAIGDVSVLEFVRWVGVARASQKLHPATQESMDRSGGRTRLYVSVFEGDDMSAAEEIPFGSASTVDPDGSEVQMEDARSILTRSNGWMQRALEQEGVTVISYTARQKAFLVEADESHLETLTALDFVQFIEPIFDAELAAAPHDETRAMIMSDRLRLTSDGGTTQTVVMGLVDSGLENAHDDLGIFGWGWNCTSESSAWDDSSNGGNGHGTHVAGTLFGRGIAEVDQMGNAPGLGSWNTGRIFNYRRFPNPCGVGTDVIVDRFSNSVTDSNGNTTRRPHVVNNSWGSFSGSTPVGTEFEARVADDATFDHDQLWVWAAGNSGPTAGTISIQSAAKNSFVVGNVVDYISSTVGDPGNLWTSSSRGPTGDGRWKPSVTAPGRRVRSCLANDNSGYAGYSGTSMASPHAASAAAMLMDARPFFLDKPEAMQSLLMATAMTDDNTVITTETNSHLDNYGAGRINVYKARYNFGGNTSTTWTWQNSGSNWTFADFTVPVGCTRIVAVMSALETSASSGASQALINDWDFYLDRDPIDPAGDTGEYFAQQSSIDNNELRIIENPASGPWRWKVYPDSVTSSTKIGVTVYFVVDDTTPDATLSLTASDSFVQPGDDVDVTANVDVDDYVASAVVLDRSGSSATLVGATSTLADGIVTDLTDNESGGADLTLGDITDNRDRAATWTLRYSTEGNKSVSVEARSDNMIDKNATVNIVVDGTQPSAVSGLTSTSHTINEWSNDPTIDYSWTQAVDTLSGIDGYGIFEASIAISPGAILDIGAVSSYTSPAWTSSTSPRYFNIRSVDRSGNWDTDYESTGPYFIDVTEPGLATFAGSTHPVGTARCERTITVNWNAATDAHSGVEGYGLFWTTSPTSAPADVLDTTGTSDTVTLAPGTYYLNMKTVDVAGNWTSTYSSFGPFIISDECGTNYCAANPSSTGAPARIRALGSDTAAANDLTIEAYDMPLNTFGLLATSLAPGFVANPGGSQGNLCLGGSLGRYNANIMNSGATGSFQIPLDLTMTPTSSGMASVAAGETRYWQVWYRDANPTPTSNFTDGVCVTFY